MRKLRRLGGGFLLSLFLVSVGISALSPLVIFAQNSGSARMPGNQTVVVRYETLRALTGAKKTDNNSQSVCLLDLKSLTKNDYENPSVSPLKATAGNTFSVPSILFGSSNSNLATISCAKALSEYYETAYQGASKPEKRQAFIKDHYNTGSFPYTPRTNWSKLQTDIKNYATSLIAGRSDSFNLWRDHVISDAFGACWKWKDSSIERTDETRAKKENWIPEDNRLRVVGYMGAMRIYGTYTTGLADCDSIRSFIIDNPSNRYLLTFGESALEEALDEEILQYKLEKAREILASDNYDSVKFCVAGASAESSFSGMPIADQASSIAEGIIKEYDKLRYAQGRLTVNELSTAYIKDCIVNKSPLASKIKSTLEVTAPTTDGLGDQGNDDQSVDQDSCDANLNSPLSWILCPIIDTIEGALRMFGDYLKDNLRYEVSDSLYEAWAIFRNIANILFVIAFLILIISQTLGGKL